MNNKIKNYVTRIKLKYSPDVDYKTKTYGMGIRYVTPCPYSTYSRSMVGLICIGCEHFVSIDKKNDKVKCKKAQLSLWKCLLIKLKTIK